MARAAAHSAEDLRRLAARSENRVLAWAEPGARRGDALSAEQVSALVHALQGEVVDAVRARPGTNELMLRMELGGRAAPPPAPEGYTWAEFAAHYPTFWGKVTSASATRRDMMTIEAMLAARRDFEAGRSAAADERDLEAQIQSDIIALNMDTHGAGAGNSPQARRAVEQARLRRIVLERQFAHVRVPAEELAALGSAFAPARSCVHDILERDKAAREGAQRGPKAAAKAAAKKADIPLPAPVVRFARRLLELRVNIAKERGQMPPELEPKGATFMPTYVRSAQLRLEWRDEWAAVPAAAA